MTENKTHMKLLSGSLHPDTWKSVYVFKSSRLMSLVRLIRLLLR